MNVRLAQHALARHFNYFSQTVIPNVYFAGGEMDVAVVTRARYLIEVEIKATLSDWHADRAKGKWAMTEERAKVSRFYYAVPTELVGKNPMWVPVECGLLELQWDKPRGRYWVHERIAAIRSRAAPSLSEQQLCQLLNSTYHRFWRRELAAA